MIPSSLSTPKGLAAIVSPAPPPPCALHGSPGRKIVYHAIVENEKGTCTTLQVRNTDSTSRPQKVHIGANIWMQIGLASFEGTHQGRHQQERPRVRLGAVVQEAVSYEARVSLHDQSFVLISFHVHTRGTISADVPDGNQPLVAGKEALSLHLPCVHGLDPHLREAKFHVTFLSKWNVNCTEGKTLHRAHSLSGLNTGLRRSFHRRLQQSNRDHAECEEPVHRVLWRVRCVAARIQELHVKPNNLQWSYPREDIRKCRYQSDKLQGGPKSSELPIKVKQFSCRHTIFSKNARHLPTAKAHAPASSLPAVNVPPARWEGTPKDMMIHPCVRHARSKSSIPRRLALPLPTPWRSNPLASSRSSPECADARIGSSSLPRTSQRRHVSEAAARMLASPSVSHDTSAWAGCSRCGRTELRCGTLYLWTQNLKGGGRGNLFCSDPRMNRLALS